MFRKLAFVVGVAVGLFNLTATATVVLTYYFTGRIPSMIMVRDATGARRPHLALLTVDEVVDQAREQERQRLEGREAHETQTVA